MSIRRHPFRSVFEVALTLPILLGCATGPRPLPEVERAAIEQRASTHFARAILLKPLVVLPEDLLAVRLAPLLLIEAPGTSGVPELREAPAVFFSEGSMLWNGRVHAQVTYQWRLNLLAPPGSAAQAEALWQGVRITLNSAGAPVIWEVLRDRSQARLVFVARSLEEAVLRELGPALPGRRHAVEQAQEESPEVLVVRVIEDGPIPMGPIVHLRAATGDVTAVICRCMPPQVRDLAGQTEYELLPVEADPDSPARETVQVSPGQALRLPSGF